MKESTKLWLKNAGGIRGVLAGAILQADKLSHSISFSKNYPPHRLEVIWRMAAGTLNEMAKERGGVKRMRWFFEHAEVYCHPRTDGLSLVLLTEVQGELLDAQGLERLCADFAEMDA